MSIRDLFQPEIVRHAALSSGHVVPDPERCVQCGICSFNCPIGLDVRRYAWQGEPIHNPRCLTCGECIHRCPRGALRFARTGEKRA